jgi:hypothetical protein
MDGGIIARSDVPTTAACESGVTAAKSGVTIVPPPIPSSPDAVPAVTPIATNCGAAFIASNSLFSPSSRLHRNAAAFAGTIGADSNKKYANIFRNASQFTLAVNLAPNGADTIADAPKIPAARASTNPSLANVLALTAAVATTATSDVPETTRCGIDVELANTGTMSAPPPTPTVAPKAPARNPSGALIIVARARSVAATEDASPIDRTVVRRTGAEDARDGPATRARADATLAMARMDLEPAVRGRKTRRRVGTRLEMRRDIGMVTRAPGGGALANYNC